MQIQYHEDMWFHKEGMEKCKLHQDIWFGRVVMKKSKHYEDEIW